MLCLFITPTPAMIFYKVNTLITSTQVKKPNIIITLKTPFVPPSRYHSPSRVNPILTSASID